MCSIIKETPTQMFSSDYYEIFRNIYFEEHLRMAASKKIFQTRLHAFYKQRFFLTQSQCCLTFSWMELQMLLRCCLIHISIITLGYFLYLLFLCPCLGLGLFMSYLCDLFFIFILIFIKINRMNTDTLVLLLIFQDMFPIIFGW